MSTSPMGWAPGDPWIAKGFKQAKTLNLGEVDIRLLPFPYFLATKFSAFFDRGLQDYWASKDYEDIIFLIDNVPNFPERVLNADEEVKAFLISAFDVIMRKEELQEVILGNLPFEGQMSRYERILESIKSITR